MLTYTKAKKIFATARYPSDGKPLCNNTRLYKKGNSYIIRLHNTNIIEICRNGTLVLNTGGWYTMLTGDRIRRYAGVCYWRYYKTDHYVMGRYDSPSPFFDGIRINYKGEPMLTKRQIEKYKRPLEKAVTKYLNRSKAMTDASNKAVKEFNEKKFSTMCYELSLILPKNADEYEDFKMNNGDAIRLSFWNGTIRYSKSNTEEGPDKNLWTKTKDIAYNSSWGKIITFDSPYTFPTVSLSHQRMLERIFAEHKDTIKDQLIMAKLAL